MNCIQTALTLHKICKWQLQCYKFLDASCQMEPSVFDNVMQFACRPFCIRYMLKLIPLVKSDDRTSWRNKNIIHRSYEYCSRIITHCARTQQCWHFLLWPSISCKVCVAKCSIWKRICYLYVIPVLVWKKIWSVWPLLRLTLYEYSFYLFVKLNKNI